MRRIPRLFAGVGVILALGCMLLAIAMRLVTHDPERWHIDPFEATLSGKPNDYLVSGFDVLRFDTPPGRVARVFDGIARDTGAERVAGSPEGLHVTYVARSRVLAFPDYISVRVEPVGSGSALAVYARARFGYSDMGVNRKRVEAWLSRLEATLAE